MRRAPLGLVVALAVAVCIVGCGGSPAKNDRSPAANHGGHRFAVARLHRAPAAVASACRSLAHSRMVAVLCPAGLPAGRWAVNHTTLRDGRCTYLLDLDTRPFGENVPFHALAGGRCQSWPLTARNGRWPADRTIADDLGLIGAKPLRPGQPSTTTPIPVRPRVLARIHVGVHRGLLLQQASYPDGGVHGGHIAAIWNQDENGYVLSLHFTERHPTSTSTWRQMVIATATAMSASSNERFVRLAVGATAGTVISRKPAEQLLRRGAALNLTSVLPRSVRRACATATATSRAVVLCPPLVPSGAALVAGVDGVLRRRDFRSGFVANFESRSVRPSHSAPGHWTIAEGAPEALRTLLHPSGYDTGRGPIAQRRLRIEHTSATLWSVPSFRSFHGIYGGHEVIVWQCAGREYQVSMHGQRNRERVLLIATALIIDELPPICRR